MNRSHRSIGYEYIHGGSSNSETDLKKKKRSPAAHPIHREYAKEEVRAFALFFFIFEVRKVINYC